MRTKSKANKLKKLDAAYLAGIIDGEGSIMLWRRKKTKSFTVVVVVGNTHFGLIHHIKTITGTGYKQKVIYKFGNRKPQLHWRISNVDAVDILNQIMQYMVVKFKQAKYAVFAYEKYLRNGCFRLKGRDLQNVIMLAGEIKKLNKKGSHVI